MRETSKMHLPRLTNHRGEVVAVVQARTGSTRLPGKVLLPLAKTTVLGLLVKRLSNSSLVNRIILAIPDSSPNMPLREEASRLGIEVSLGPERDVLERFKNIFVKLRPRLLVRVTADCPLIDPQWVDELILEVDRCGAGYGRLGLDFPDGLGAECITPETFETLCALPLTSEQREHVTLGVWGEESISKFDLKPPFRGGNFRLTLDEPGDYEVLKKVCALVDPTSVSAGELVELGGLSPDLFEENQRYTRNEGTRIGTGLKMWRRAERSIAGGNLSAHKLLQEGGPLRWPIYFESASGVRVTDLDGREYLDFGLMGAGSNSLGYAHPIVDEAVKRVIEAGTISSLNSTEEVLLAEKLISLHPWSARMRLAASRSEALSAAVRLAQFATGKFDRAVCSAPSRDYWGVADGFGFRDLAQITTPLASAPPEDSLSPAGRVTTFAYNDLEGLRHKFMTNQVGAVVMEVERDSVPFSGFLEGVRRLCSEHGAALIFDEWDSGFRRNLGGLHLEHSVDPDICILGGSIGNGYPINVILGTAELMQAFDHVSSPGGFRSDRVGPTASLATIKVMEAEDVTARITRLGARVSETWREVAQSWGQEIETLRLPALSVFRMTAVDQGLLQAILESQFLQRGFLAGPYFCPSTAHEEMQISAYETALHEIWGRIADAMSDPDRLTRLAAEG